MGEREKRYLQRRKEIRAGLVYEESKRNLFRHGALLPLPTQTEQNLVALTGWFYEPRTKYVCVFVKTGQKYSRVSTKGGLSGKPNKMPGGTLAIC